MKRRTFLKALAILVAAGKLPKSSLKRSQATQNGESVLVVGAGMSGIAAARRLADAGYAVTILEGRTRLGGRTWTDDKLGVPLDMGGSWVHGIDGNPIWELVQRFGIETKDSDEDNEILYWTDGELYTNKENEELWDYAEEIEERMYVLTEDSDQDMSWGQALEQVMTEEELDEEDRREILFAFNSYIEQDYAADLNNLSGWWGTEDEEFGGKEVVFPKGYIQVVEALAAGLDVRLGQLVQRIVYGNSGVTVSTNQGDFSADYVIVTLPLGVLKKGTVSFEPALPAEKTAAINRLDMGVLNKTYLRFPSVFWEEDVEWIDYVSAKKGEWSSWLNMYYYIGEPILLGFNAATYGTAIEAMSDEQIVAAAMQTLRVIYGDNIPDPNGYSITRWASDPFSYGSYSYVPTFASNQDYDTLARPVGDRLYFAGEATIGEYTGTVHGAYLSGMRAADELMS